jgi:hypothetical protein
MGSFLLEMATPSVENSSPTGAVNRHKETHGVARLESICGIVVLHRSTITNHTAVAWKCGMRGFFY